MLARLVRECVYDHRRRMQKTGSAHECGAIGPMESACVADTAERAGHERGVLTAQRIHDRPGSNPPIDVLSIVVQPINILV